ncbi:hypothetical protein, partial [Microbacterium petrolearium]
MQRNQPETTELGPSITDAATVSDPGTRRSILIAVSVALMAVISSVTGLNVAQPDLAVDFEVSQGAVL